MDKPESKIETLIEVAERLQKELEQLVENLDKVIEEETLRKGFIRALPA